MVNYPTHFKNESVLILFLAEEYYKNDYPEDEEDSSGRNLFVRQLLIPLLNPLFLKMSSMRAQTTTI